LGNEIRKAVVQLMVTKRAKEIQEIISDLELLKLDPKYREAAEINIGFFKAARSVFSFIHWLVAVAPKLRNKREILLELGDLPLEKWQRRGYKGLASMERHRFAGIMSTGFVRELSQVILKVGEIKNNNEPVVVLDLGFGSGYLGRQVFEKLPDVPLVYIGVDVIPVNLELAKMVFRPLHKAGEIVFKEVSMVSDEIIDTLCRQASVAVKKVVAVCLGDIFELDKYISPGKVDIMCHSRVLHHIRPVDRARLVDICRRLSPITVEMDDRYGFWFKFWAIIGTWAISNPTLMNGAILSCLRDPSKEELTGYFKLVPPFSYIRLIFGQDTYPQDEKWQTAMQTLVKGFSFKELA
jgi:hypothetical protein